jgi:hypothetical protein
MLALENWLNEYQKDGLSGNPKDGTSAHEKGGGILNFYFWILS